MACESPKAGRESDQPFSNFLGKNGSVALLILCIPYIGPMFVY